MIQTGSEVRSAGLENPGVGPSGGGIAAAFAPEHFRTRERGAGGVLPHSLRYGEIHVWHTFLPDLGDERHRLEALLDRGERARADRFVRERDRDAFVLRRGVRRLILAHYLGIRARSIKFQAGEGGKPELDRVHDSMIRFSTTSSGPRMLMALSWSRELGVDVEQARAPAGLPLLLDRVLTLGERHSVERSPPGDRHVAFLRYWTAKEAYLKAVGVGLQKDPRDVEFGPSDNDGLGLHRVVGCDDAPRKWSVVPVPEMPRLLVGLVVEGPPVPIRLFDGIPADSVRARSGAPAN